MAQRILEPGQIETLAQRSIARVLLPDRETIFARRAARLRALAHDSALAGYLEFLAALSDAQQAAVLALDPPRPAADAVAQAKAHGMPLVPARTTRRDPAWIGMLRQLVHGTTTAAGIPPGVARVGDRLRAMSAGQIEAQADALLANDFATIDLATAPLIMAALQVYWVASTGAFAPADVPTLDVPGVCPFCGTLPVASVVRAQSPYQGYRYLHCALCAVDWHLVRVQCSTCGADGKQIAYHALQANDAAGEADGVGDSAVRAEACSSCNSYRKILYQEKDIAVDPVADDVASLALDVLMSEHGFHRASGNPLFWQAPQD